MKTKTFVIIILILFLNLFSASAANYGGDLKIKVELRPFNLNPIYAANDTALMINKQIFDTLVNYNKQGQLTTNLAESWQVNEDSTVFTFNLKQNVYFHPYQINGKSVPLNEREVKAEDWKKSFEYLAAAENKSPYAELFTEVEGYDEYRQGESEEISGIKILDKYNLEIELEESYAPFIYNLAKRAAVVMPLEAVLNNYFNFSITPVGTGAFRFDSFSKNQVTLVKSDNYWKNNYQEQDLPYLDQIQVNFEGEKNLEDNLEEFDLFQLNSADFASYQQQKNRYSNYQMQKLADKNLYYAAFNYNSYLDQTSNSNELKKRLRYSLDKCNFADSSNFNRFIFPEDGNNSHLLFNKINEGLLKDVNDNISSQLKNLQLITNNSKINNQLAEFIKNKFKEDNIDLEIKEYNWAEYFKKLNSPVFESQLFIMSANYNNRFEFINDNFYSTAENNFFNYQNERMDNLIDYLKLVNNNESRERAYEIITEILVNDSPFLFLIQGADSYLISEEIKNQEIFKNIYSKYNFEMLYFE
ncbi:peptide/nickel transport system substrate-binding protein [Halanaerobium saccharolyticum]|uniref:Peptide/nickel transport system substrate-binding protein n=1 Tax=Halanaerobium saccharolyticum TaxID=43595 RepID=A0A4V6Q877_9FIRM|nr:ABC transporter substrate-binding protein [Halanaerobium saccharolyticum]RAK10508.1 peptide/nickel transport system substrate-binding protein [Halanaerobium saccharolyticum]TDW06735.1 peptide/nickel transport system substrate-binding protein [Halanaerobium saccharolyticum]TDX62370.1 peptide/nickel transport system substrate-binding protein [Halanaerobium saccharolyticum]